MAAVWLQWLQGVVAAVVRNTRNIDVKRRFGARVALTAIGRSAALSWNTQL